MRLLRIDRDAHGEGPPQLSLSEFIGSETDMLPYAILSHRWRDEEVLFADMAGDRAVTQEKKGYRKLEASCKVALEHGLHYLWCDTCCIDKSSSAELSEAINSMYEYYAKSQLCIAYLDDIEDDPVDDLYLSRAIWFSRGWTLQELIAPRELHFYSQGWKKLGTKATLPRQTSVASGIAEDTLSDATAFKRTCISEKMSWAAHRTTTRPEDRAYSLFGIFGVHMPPLYGEGAENAFRRLQLEILQTTTDHTLFAWDSDTTTGDMLAPSVSCFAHGSDYTTIDYADLDIFRGSTSADRIGPLQLIREKGHIVATQAEPQIKPDFTMTNSGLHIQLPMNPWLVLHRRPVKDDDSQSIDLRVAFLSCRLKLKEDLVAVCLRKNHNHTYLSYSRVAFEGHSVLCLDRSMYQDRRLPITDFNPVWISKPVPGQRQDMEGYIGPSVKRIRFELWYKAPSPANCIFWSRKASDEQIPMFENGRKKLRELGDGVPKKFKDLEMPVQHYINGALPFEGSSHEMIALEGHYSLFASHSDAAVAFGTINRALWVSFPLPVTGMNYAWILSEIGFPGGTHWRRERGSASCLLPGTEVCFTQTEQYGPVLEPSPKATLGPEQHYNISPQCDFHIVVGPDDGEELSLRFYVTSTSNFSKGWAGLFR